MKAMIIALASLFSISAFAIPDVVNGVYTGTLQARDTAGTTLQVDAVTVVQNGKLTTEYSGQSYEISFSETTSKGFYDIFFGGQKAGEGVCFVDFCNYTAEVPGLQITETVALIDGQMVRMGEFQRGKTRKAFKMVLTKQQ